MYKAYLQLGKQALECFRGNKHLNVALLVHISITKKIPALENGGERQAALSG